MSGCNPALAGRDPASTASIVNVGALAGGKPRVFEWGVEPPGRELGDTSYGGVVVQMWTKGCAEITYSKWRSLVRYEPFKGPRHDRRRTFEIPPSAMWMTVTTNDTLNVTWRLT